MYGVRRCVGRQASHQKKKNSTNSPERDRCRYFASRARVNQLGRPRSALQHHVLYTIYKHNQPHDKMNARPAAGHALRLATKVVGLDPIVPRHFSRTFHSTIPAARAKNQVFSPYVDCRPVSQTRKMGTHALVAADMMMNRFD